MKVKEIASIIKGEVCGDENLEIKGVSGLDIAKEADISFLADNKFLDLAKISKASCLITKKPFSIEGKTVIFTENPALSFIKVIEYFYPYRKIKPGISHHAIIEDDVSMGDCPFIAPYVVICEGVRIGKNIKIFPFTYIGSESIIGDDVEIKTSVTILNNTIIGNKVIIHPGTVIGSDGYGYVTDRKRHYKIPQIGKVVIEDDCEIGANVTIDRASFKETRIKQGTKIDNLVQIGHNVTVGENNLIVAQVGIAGSSKLGRNVTLAGQVGVTDHCEIGDGVIVAAQAGVSNNVPPNAIYWGCPARDLRLVKRIHAATVKLPELLKRVKKIEKTIEKLEREVDAKKRDI